MTTKCEQQPQDQQETYTPEEVQRDLDIVAEVLVAYVARSDVSSPSRAALSRLAAQAARVPGLLEWREKMLSALASGLDYTPAPEQAEGLLRVIITEADEFEQRAEAAESERDATKELLRSAHTEVAALQAQIANGAAGAAQLESERDAAQKDAARLAGEKADAVLGASEQRARAERAEADLQAERTTTASLRERVATLEKDVAEVVNLLPDEKRRAWKEHVRSAIAVEAGLLAGIRELLPDDYAWTECPSEAVYLLADRAEQADSELNDLRPEVERLTKRDGELCADLSTAEARVKELEAENSRLRDFNAGYDKMTDTLMTLAGVAPQPPPAPAQTTSDLWIAAEGTARAAYERALERREPTGNALSEGVRAALRVFTPTPPPGLREAVGEVVPWLRALARLQVTDDVVLDLPVAGDDMATHSILAGEVRAVVAAYDATGGEDYPRPVANCGHVNAVDGLCTHPDNITPECHEHACPLLRKPHPDAEDAAKYRAAVERAKDKEGMARALYSAVRGKTMRWEDATGTVRYDAEEAAVAVAEHLLTLDTPPSGPGGGEVPAPDDGEPLSAEDESLINEAWKQHAAITPSHTPEVPPLKDGADLPAPDESPVALECDGMRVLADGTPQALVMSGAWVSMVNLTGSDEFWQRHVLNLARALPQAVRHAAQLGAEDIRERAAKEVQIAGDLCEDWHLHLSDVRELEQRIRALPGKAVRRG
ncbi:hypothetical protein JKA73_17765 [Myxococcus xanthus]|uniref:hypothetical protein n=1 Tax=Myxococcus xanthus TaxID=34 RepID=UPI0019177C14|nr:hypothetical protein [Myxococcus xanthus]QQR47782.1 hypothetical protein JKA73_17765 [Myxococcus xanthus]